MNDNQNLLLSTLRDVLPFFERNAEQETYGYGMPDDPRDFMPDPELSTAEEKERHAAACRAWDAANGEPEGWQRPAGSEWLNGAAGVMHVTRAPWGPGSWVYRDPEMCELRDKIRAAIAAVKEVQP